MYMYMCVCVWRLIFGILAGFNFGNFFQNICMYSTQSCVCVCVCVCVHGVYCMCLGVYLSTFAHLVKVE